MRSTPLLAAIAVAVAAAPLALAPDADAVAVAPLALAPAAAGAPAPATATAPASASATATVTGTATTIAFGPQLARAGVTAPTRVVLAVTATRVAGGTTIIDHRGTIRLRAGQRSLTLGAPRVMQGLRTAVTATVGGGARRTLFFASGSTLQLSADGARLLSRRLAVTVRPGTVGTITPAAGPRPVAAGAIDWGYSTPLRTVFQAAFPPILSGGATQSLNGSFTLPVIGGSYDSATRTGTITSRGAFRIGYQIAPTDAAGAHGIWVTLGNLALTLDGTHGELVAASESGYHDTMVVAMATRTIATLDLSAPPAVDGDTVTWTAVPATLAPGGAALVAAFQDAPGRPSLGDVHRLDPITFSVRLAG